MRKLFILACMAIALLSACNKSDIDDLKDRVSALEASKSVIGIDFNANGQMILKYSTNETETLDLAEGLSGLNLVKSEGISSINYNETTKVLTVTLSNGNVSEFKIYGDTYAGYVAVLISDVNGKMFISEIAMGAVPFASFEYDENFNMTSMISSEIYNGQILKNFEVQKTYSGNVLTGFQYLSYAKEKGIDYDEEYISSKDTVMQVNPGNYSRANGDSTYTFYSYNYFDGTNYHYTVYPFAVKHVTSSSYNWSYYAAFDANTAYYFNGIVSSWDGSKYTIWYAITYKYTKIGDLEIGDVAYSESINAECNASGNPVKVSYADMDDVYLNIDYTADGLYPTKAMIFYKDSEDNWQKDSDSLTFVYDTQKRLVAINKSMYDHDTTVVKFVYDDNGNPVEIWTWNDELTGYYDYFDPFQNTTDPWQEGEEVLEPEGLQLMATVDYDYAYKNFLGNTLGSVIPALKNIKVYNAPIRVNYTREYAHGTIDYSNFNDSGYPESVKLNVYEGMNNPYSLELSLSYITKN